MPSRMTKHYALYSHQLDFLQIHQELKYELNTSGVRFLLISEINPEDAVPSGGITIKTY